MNAPVLDAKVLPASNAKDTAESSGDVSVVLSAVEAEPSWRAAAQRCAAVAAQFADAVDREARFPHEAFEALKRERLLSAMVPTAFGGAGLSLADVGSICESLAQGCASTAMVYAMHQIQVACIESHGSDRAWHRQLLAQLVEHQWLLASATSEETIGGNMRTSACSVELDGARLLIKKLAPTTFVRRTR